MAVGREPISVDQRVVFWKMEYPRSRIAWLSNLCQDHAASGMVVITWGFGVILPISTQLNPRSSKPVQVRSAKRSWGYETGRTVDSLPVFVKPCC